ncbi:unnamed protein product, partial [Ectocarpus sp. 13 AM-2016]
MRKPQHSPLRLVGGHPRKSSKRPVLPRKAVQARPRGPLPRCQSQPTAVVTSVALTPPTVATSHRYQRHFSSSSSRRAEGAGVAGTGVPLGVGAEEEEEEDHPF